MYTSYNKSLIKNQILSHPYEPLTAPIVLKKSDIQSDEVFIECQTESSRSKMKKVVASRSTRTYQYHLDDSKNLEVFGDTK